MTGRGMKRPLGPTYWLIVKNENCRIEVLIIHLAGGEEALPVFSFEEEAEMYLGLEALGDGWQVRESRAGELTSMLYGLCPHVGYVALDPLPRMVAERTVRLLSLHRKSFLRDLLDESELKRVAARGSRSIRRMRPPFTAISDETPDAEVVMT